jgi:hypothetical protein
VINALLIGHCEVESMLGYGTGKTCTLLITCSHYSVASICNAAYHCWRVSRAVPAERMASGLSVAVTAAADSTVHS